MADLPRVSDALVTSASMAGKLAVTGIEMSVESKTSPAHDLNGLGARDDDLFLQQENRKPWFPSPSRISDWSHPFLLKRPRCTGQ